MSHLHATLAGMVPPDDNGPSCGDVAPEEVSLWRTGDPWRDLTDVVHEHDVVTAVTRNGTTHVLDRAAGTRQRIPVEGGHGLDRDFQLQRLTAVMTATPCGLVVASPGLHDIHYSTGLWALWAGKLLTWPYSPTGRHITTAILRRQDPQAPRHPAGPCGAYYCPERATV